MQNNPKKINKKQLISLLKKDNINPNLIFRINNIPNVIIKNGYNYDLDINVAKHETHNEYNLNYHCIDNMEFLFNNKIFKDIEISLKFLECELNKNIKLIK